MLPSIHLRRPHRRANPGIAIVSILSIAFLWFVDPADPWLVPVLALLAASLVAALLSRWFHARAVPRARRADPGSSLHI